MNDDGQGFAYGAGYEQAAKDAQRKIDALVAALRRIHEHETRADRRHTGMVDIDEVLTLQRIALAALKAAGTS